METGLVIKTTGSLHTVKKNSVKVNCKIKGNYRIKGIKTTNPVTVGDIVDFYQENEGETGWITRIHERKNYIIRRSINLSKEAHLIAANIDQAFLIISLTMPETPLEFIDRFLITAEAYHIVSTLIFNKIDLYDKVKLEYLNHLKSIYTAIGYECIETSAVTGENIDKLKQTMQNKITLVAGNSGVGKSTLINCIDPKLNLKVDGISEYHKTGKHTTTFSEMFELEYGGYIIDTPGIKGFGIIDFEKQEIGLFFPEIFKMSEKCQFYNCTHTHEPNCAVRKAVEEGKIAASRYRSYTNILFDNNNKYRK
ncbi:MAG: ribosome small subunit-dependent GTPase A [Bacteroidales bacterium]|nr:ribosome small subunit-dependent GTPase A [Bacteroidales bacterium]